MPPGPFDNPQEVPDNPLKDRSLPLLTHEEAKGRGVHGFIECIGRHLPKFSSGRSVQSVILSDHEYPDCQGYRDLILDCFKRSVFTTTNYADVTPEQLDARGKGFGEVQLDLIQDPTPKSCKAVRSVGLREQLLKQKIDDFRKGGLIARCDDKAKCWSRAFLVPKMGGKWRLVIDYRWLNSQLKGQTFLNPVIEDQLAKQRGKFVFTLVDLEDGFHQMRLA